MAEEPPKLRWNQYSLGHLFIFVTIVVLLFAFWASLIRPILEHDRRYKRFGVCIDKLAQKRPAHLTVTQWDSMIGWTSNLQGNCLSARSFLKDEPRFGRFVDELEKKVEGDVGIETIDWIWDEVVEISGPGQRYSDNWRPTTPDQLKATLTHSPWQ